MLTFYTKLIIMDIRAEDYDERISELKNHEFVDYWIQNIGK